MNNNLEVFNQIRSELTLLVEKHKDLKINGVDDVNGYLKVKEARAEIRKAEIDLEKLAKAERQNALDYQRGIIKLEKDLLEITNPKIEEFDKQMKEIEELKAREERKLLLPDRKEKLAEIGKEMTDEEILNFDEKTWATFYSQAKLSYLEAKENERMAEQRKAEEEAKIEKAKEEARQQALKEAEEKAEREKEKEAQRILQEEARKKAEEEARQKDEAFKNWLKENGNPDFNSGEWKIETQGNKSILYKKVSEFIK